MHQRIPGFDIARAYAIFGMFIVNFNTVFGSLTDKSGGFALLQLFSGNSSSLFVLLAGIGLSLLTARARAQGDPQAQRQQRAIILRRSWFLFGAGLVLYLWWPADILHFYGGYMHIAALVAFAKGGVLLLGAGLAVLAFHLLLGIIPYETGWNFATLEYLDFWTLPGFLRNTLYNGWNPIFPWLAYFLLGMWLGRLPLHEPALRRRLLFWGMGLYAVVAIAQAYISASGASELVKLYFSADYIPPFLPFQLSTVGASLVILSICLYLGERFGQARWARLLATTGRHTLTHYVLHLTAGMLLLSWLSGRPYAAGPSATPALGAWPLLLFAVAYFAVSLWLSHLWARRFAQGPLEQLMRRVAG